ncbi:MAG: MATE family efflux transporter [candidate division Zixibacteria bacterium]|nr:MATE family efflux transporter [candidate division Zixibacteria bacterium]
MADNNDRIRTDYTEGSVLGSIFKMGLPSMFGFLAQHIYAMVDMFWVSRLPHAESGVAAITFFSNLMWLLFAFNSLVGPGSVAVISRRYGEKEYDLTEKAIKETILLKLIFGTALAIVGWIFLTDLLYLLGARDETLRLSISYGRIFLVGLPIMYATYSIFTALRGVANPNWAMALMIGSNTLNLILDPLFIFGHLGIPAMGIRGAAVASVLSFCLTFSIGLVLFRTNWTNVRLHIVGKVPVAFESMWKIVRIGIPAWLGELSFSGSRLLITPIVASFGTAVVAAYGVSMQVFGFGISILVGMGLGLSSLIGHNLGGKKYDRAKKTGDHAIGLGIAVMTAFAVFTFVLARPYMTLFFDSSETIHLGVEILRIVAIGFPFFGAYIMLEQIHVGVGLNMPFMVFAIIHAWGLQVLPAVVVTQVFGLNETAVWWVLTLAGIITATLFYAYYTRGRWLTAKV